MKRMEAIETILNRLRKDDIALFTTGMISREAFSIRDRLTNFYMVGSMGLVSSVGLGIALNTSKRIFIFDGDGSLLMDLGTAGMIASQRPNNLFHIVLDNEVYQSTGNQPTISKDIDLARIAKSLGYRKVYRFSRNAQLRSKISILLNQKGPVFILMKVESLSHLGPPARVSVPLKVLTKRARKALAG